MPPPSSDPARGRLKKSTLKAHIPPPPPPPPPPDRFSTADQGPELDETQKKLMELWKVKTIEQGMVRVPTHFLEDLIHKESIEKFFDRIT